jgi:hypothetical protein
MRGAEDDQSIGGQYEAEVSRQAHVLRVNQMRSAYLQRNGQKIWLSTAILGALVGGVLGHYTIDHLAFGSVAGFSLGSLVSIVVMVLLSRRAAA